MRGLRRRRGVTPPRLLLPPLAARTFTPLRPGEAAVDSELLLHLLPSSYRPYRSAAQPPPPAPRGRRWRFIARQTSGGMLIRTLVSRQSDNHVMKKPQPSLSAVDTSRCSRASRRSLSLSFLLSVFLSLSPSIFLLHSHTHIPQSQTLVYECVPKLK